MKIIADSLEDYFQKTGDYQVDLRYLDKLIREIAPDLKPKLATNMGGGTTLGYGMMPYQSSAMKEPGEWPLVAIAAQKNYMALYLCAVIDGKYVAEANKAKLGKASIGKSCVRFKRLEDLNLEIVGDILKDLNSRYKSGEKLFG